MKCPKCGKLISDESEFCYYCGAKIGKGKDRIRPLGQISETFLGSNNKSSKPNEGGRRIKMDIQEPNNELLQTSNLTTIKDYTIRQEKIIKRLRGPISEALKHNIYYKNFIDMYHKKVSPLLKELVYSTSVTAEKLHGLAIYILASEREFKIKEKNGIRAFDFFPWYPSTNYLINDVYICFCLYNKIYPKGLKNTTLKSYIKIKDLLKVEKEDLLDMFTNLSKNFSKQQLLLISQLITHEKIHMQERLKSYDIFKHHFIDFILPKLIKITMLKLDSSEIEPENLTYFYYMLLYNGIDYKYKTKNINGKTYLTFTEYLKIKMHSIEWLYKKLCNEYNIEPKFPTTMTKTNPLPTYLPSLVPSHPSGPFVNVLVYSTTHFKCRKSSHQIFNINIIIPIIKSNQERTEVSVSGGYCPYCGTYFITTGDYLRLKQLGRIACRVVGSKVYYDYKEGSNFNKKSIIAQYGYTVSQKDALPAKIRQGILKTVIEDGALSNIEIRTHLEWLIRYNGEKPNMENAVAEWKEDLNFLQNYNTDNHLDFQAISLRHIHYEHK